MSGESREPTLLESPWSHWSFWVIPNVTGANRVCPDYPLVTVIPSSLYAALIVATDTALQLRDHSLAFCHISCDSLTIFVQL